MEKGRYANYPKQSEVRDKCGDSGFCHNCMHATDNYFGKKGKEQR